MMNRKNFINDAATDFEQRPTKEELSRGECFKAGVNWLTENVWLPVDKVQPDYDFRGICRQRIAIYNAKADNLDAPNHGVQILNGTVLRWDTRGRTYAMQGEAIEFTHWMLLPKDMPDKENEKSDIVERESPWLLTSNLMPEIGKHVLIVNADGWIKVGYWDGEQWWWADGFPIGTKENGDVENSSYCAMQGVVAWMPIPKLPDCVKPHYYGKDSDIE